MTTFAEVEAELKGDIERALAKLRSLQAAGGYAAEAGKLYDTRIAPVITQRPTISPPLPPAMISQVAPSNNLPPWFIAAQKEIGKREDPGNRGPVVQRYINLAHCGSQGDPWCAIFVNAMLESVGVIGTKSPSSQSFRANSHFVPLEAPALGAIVVFWRGNQVSGLGHVGFYNGEQDDYISTLGGNESDMVRVEMLPSHGTAFGLRGYYWPAGISLPLLGKVAVLKQDVVNNPHVT